MNEGETTADGGKRARGRLSDGRKRQSVEWNENLVTDYRGDC